MPSTQVGQFISLVTPLGADVLLLRGFTGQEAISQPFNFQLELVSEKPPIKLESIIGQNVTVNMALSDGNTRCFNGFVSEFAQTGQDSQFTYYQAEMVPWLWFLSQTSDCRIFQNKTVPEIVMQIFQEFGFRDFRNALQGTYERLDVAMQYRETEFNFISRLMEREGMFYFFEHEQGKHTLVIADQPAAHPVLTWNACAVIPAWRWPGHRRRCNHSSRVKAGVASREIYDERLQLRDAKHQIGGNFRKHSRDWRQSTV